MKSTKARRFSVTAETIPNPNGGGWKHSRVTIYDCGHEIGGYLRNHASYADTTFEPFELNGQWYALYSRDYTCTRVMSLPECRDIGGEAHSDGFCPVELFVPRCRNVTWRDLKRGWSHVTLTFEANADERDPGDGCEYTYGPWRSLDVGFVAGCIWGDDSTWKLEVFDLRPAATGSIVRTARFGHVELASMPLADSVSFHCNDNGSTIRATIKRLEHRDIHSGDLIDPYDV